MTNPQTTIDLKPCPFCGSKDTHVCYNGPTPEQIQHAISWGHDYDVSWFVECKFCNSCGGYGTSELIAMQNWNDRHVEAA